MYTKYVLALARGSAPAKVIDHIEGNDASSIIFAVRSVDPNECQAVAKTVAQIFNQFMFSFANKIGSGTTDEVIRNKGDWREDASFGYGIYTHYVYGYALPKNYDTWSADLGSYRDDLNNYDMFYIGRGQNARLTDHIEEAIDGLKATNLNGIVEAGKCRKIQSFLLLESLIAGPKLVRKICRFRGEYAAAKYAAAENFLINYCYGVYELENLKRGDESVRTSQAVWLSQPRRMFGGEVVWREILQEFSKLRGRRVVRQKLASELTVAEMNAQFQIFPVRELPANIILNTPIAMSDGVDAFYSLNLLGPNLEPLLHIQLNLSHKEVGVCINLRKVESDSPLIFSSRIADLFFDGNIDEARRYIGIEGRPTAYFKPCIKDQKKGKDTWFDLRTPNERRYDLSGAPLGLVTGTTDYSSFCDALGLLSNLVIN